MMNRFPLLLALAFVACDTGIPDDTEDGDTTVEPDTTDVDTELDTADIDTEVDTEEDTELDTDEPHIGDVNEINDTPDQATPITLPHAQNDLDLHDSDDDDFFELVIAERTGVRVRIEFTHADGDLDMRMERDDGAPLGTSQSTDNQETLQPILEPGTYYIEVYGYQGATGAYDISVEPFAVEEVDITDVFSDLMVTDLSSPEVFDEGLVQTFALASDIYNMGTAPAPGSSLGLGTGEFRLRQLDGSIVASGTKGPIFFTNNGGCPGTLIYDEWVERGEPHIPGSENNNSLTDPGCIDFYGAGTNNGLDTPLVITDPTVVPDGDYYYELEIDAAGTYAWEAAFARGNNSSWRPIRIRTRASGARLVETTGPLIVGGQVTIDPGSITTVFGSGDPLISTLDAVPTSGSNIGRVWGVARDLSGNLLASLPDAGALVRLLPGGASEVLITGMPGIRGIDVAANGDIVVADATGNALWQIPWSNGAYGVPVQLTVSGLTLDEPSGARFTPDGGILVANTGANNLLRLDGSTPTVLMGTGDGGRGGDGGPGVDAELYRPMDLDIRADGMVVIADAHSNRLRILNTHPTNTLTLGGVQIGPGEANSLAGIGKTAEDDADDMDNGTYGYNGNLRHSRASVLDWPTGVQLMGDRVFLIDSDNHRLRVIDEHGTMHRISGAAPVPSSETRTPGSSSTDVGDGDDAGFADLNHPMGLFVTETTNGYQIDVADSGNHRVRTLTDVVLTPGPSLGE